MIQKPQATRYPKPQRFYNYAVGADGRLRDLFQDGALWPHLTVDQHLRFVDTAGDEAEVSGREKKPHPVWPKREEKKESLGPPSKGKHGGTIKEVDLPNALKEQPVYVDMCDYCGSPDSALPDIRNVVMTWKHSNRLECPYLQAAPKPLIYIGDDSSGD